MLWCPHTFSYQMVKSVPFSISEMHSTYTEIPSNVAFPSTGINSMYGVSVTMGFVWNAKDCNKTLKFQKCGSGTTRYL